MTEPITLEQALDTATDTATRLSAGIAAPSGTFTAATAGWYFSCGLRTSGTIEYWGDGAIRIG